MEADNIVEKGENAGQPEFSPFPIKSSKTVFVRVVRARDCVKKLSFLGFGKKT